MWLICICDSLKSIRVAGVTDGCVYDEIESDREDSYFIVIDNGNSGYYSKCLFITEVEFRKQSLELLLSLL